MHVRTSRRSPVRALIAVAGLIAATATAFAAPAAALPGPDTIACPDYYPDDALTAGQPVDGLTVSTGTQPETFTGEVLGVVKDGITPGLDMIMVRLTSSEIDRVGIWAGMSGSPVYAADGRIIGAVAYGLAVGPSPVAGVTPAKDMKDLIGTGAPTSTLRALAETRHVALPIGMQRRLISEGLATSSEASQGLQRLPLPMSVSGMISNARLNTAASLMGLSDVRLYRAGSAPATTADDPHSEIFPGSNLAASMSYGDFSVVGTGTTTMVCGDQVIGFGHPFNWTGDATLNLHGADAIYIQEDPTVAGFKVSNPTDRVGVITGDHMAGISGVLGQYPDTTLVHSVVTLTGGSTRTGDTFVSVPDFLPDLTALAEVANQDRVFDRLGSGSALLHFTVSGTTAAGEPFTLVRTNRFASADDISFESILEMADDVAAIVNNDFTDVTISDIRITTTMNPVNRAYIVGKVERKVGTSFVRLTDSSVVRAKAGGTVTLRVTLHSRRDAFGSKVVLLRVPVPAARAGTFGALVVGQSGDDGGFGLGQSTPGSFDDLINQLAGTPRNDALQAEIDVMRNNGTILTGKTAKLVYDVVQGSRVFEFRIAA
jgi:hypothetical protein